MITTLLLVTAGVTVSLPAAVEVRGTELTLGAVATVSGADADLVARVREASLGYAPAPGFSRLLDRRRLASDLERLLPAVEVELIGAARCRVTPALTTISAARLLEQGGRPLRELFAGVDARIVADGAVGDLIVPAANDTLELRPDLRQRDPRPGAWSVPVEVVVDGAVYRTIWTRWSVELWERRQVLRRDVAAGQTLSAADFELARVPVGTGPEAHALDPVAFGHAVARRNLARGAVVTDRDVQRELVVRKGWAVELEIRRGAVTVRARAIAQRDARVGDRIPVRLERTGKELVVVVTGPESAELRLN